MEDILLMANVESLITRKHISPVLAEDIFREINERRFGDLFTIKRVHGTVFEFHIQDLSRSVKGWDWCFFDFYWRTRNRICSKWPCLDWHMWLWVVLRNEYLAVVDGWVRPEDDPVPNYTPKSDQFPTYWDWFKRGFRSPETAREQFDHIMSNCPEKLWQVLEGG